MACNCKNIPSLLGRLIFGGFFICSGINHFAQQESLSKVVKKKNLPQPDAALKSSGRTLKRWLRFTATW